MNRYKITLGLNDKDTKKQLVTIPKAIKTINKIVGDCTISKHKGIYKGMIENTLIIDIISDLTKKAIKNQCKELQKVFNQECIIFEQVANNSEFIY